MKENDWQLMRYFLLWLVLLFMVALPFSGNFRRWEKIATNFSPLFHLHCYRQVASIFTFISDYFVKLLLMKCLRSIETRKLQVRKGVSKLRNLILTVTRRDVQLEHCIVSISPQNPKMIWITILLRSTAPRNLMAPSSVNFVIKSFQDFTLYVNIETLNTQCKSDQEQEMWMWII